MEVLTGVIVTVVVLSLAQSPHAQLLSGCPMWGCFPSGVFAINASLPREQGGVEVVWTTKLTNTSLPAEIRLGCVTNDNSIICPTPSGFVSVVSDTGKVEWRTAPLLHDPPLPLLDVYGDFIACDGRYLCKVDNNGAFVKPNIKFQKSSTVFSLNIAQNDLFLITSKDGELICYNTAGIPYASTFLQDTVEGWKGTFIPVSTPVFSGNRAYILTEFKVDEGSDARQFKVGIPKQTRLYAVDLGSSMTDRLKEAWHTVLSQSSLPLTTETNVKPAFEPLRTMSSGKRSDGPFKKSAEVFTGTPSRRLLGRLSWRSSRRLSEMPRERASGVNFKGRTHRSYKRFNDKSLTLEPSLLFHSGIVYVSSPVASERSGSGPGSAVPLIQGRLWAVHDKGNSSSQLFSVDMAPSYLSLLDAQLQSSISMNGESSGSAEKLDTGIGFSHAADVTEKSFHFKAGLRVQKQLNEVFTMKMSVKVKDTAKLPNQGYHPVLWVTPQGDNGTILGVASRTGKVVQRISLASVLGVAKATVTSKITCVGSAMTLDTPFSLVFGAVSQNTSLTGGAEQDTQLSGSSLVAIRVSAEKSPVLQWSVPLTSDGEVVGQISASWTTGKSPQRLLLLAVTNSEKAGATLHAVG